jgi:hypothetical protein
MVINMKEGTFWFLFWVVAAVVVISLASITAIYWTNHNTKIVRLIESGVNPVAAMCAMQDDYGHHPTCVILATKSTPDTL